MVRAPAISVWIRNSHVLPNDPPAADLGAPPVREVVGQEGRYNAPKTLEPYATDEGATSEVPHE